MARRAALAIGGSIFLLIGVVFVMAALWTFLADFRGPVFASLVLASLFLGLGLILLALSRRPFRARDIRVAAETAAASAKARRPNGASEPPPGTATTAATLAVIPLAEAFVAGLMAGMKR